MKNLEFKSLLSKTFIIIVTYNGWQWINNCLMSLDQFSNILVVDNGSTDGTIKFIENRFPDVNLHRNKKNLGFGRANNIGISYALNKGAEYIFLLNQDAYLNVGTIERLIAVHSKNKEFGILSPIHLNGDGRKLDRNFSNYMSYDKNSSFLSDYVIGNEKKTVYEVPFVNAAAWLLPKSTILTIGGFDPLFFHYGEDDHYCQRVYFHGLKIGVVSGVYVRHDREQRQQPLIDKFSDEYYIGIMRNYKMKFANINDDNGLKKFIDEIKRINRLKIKSLLKLKFKYFNHFKKLENRMLHEKIRIANSRKLNKIEQPNYLNLS